MITVIIGIVVVIVIVCAIAGIYNNMVTKRNRIDNAWQNIDTQLQRRNDLIPNLVETVKGYAKHEQETLSAVISARNTADKATTEAYPDLKANTNFTQLQASLEDTENKISYARQSYNDCVLSYNNACALLAARPALWERAATFWPRTVICRWCWCARTLVRGLKLSEKTRARCLCVSGLLCPCRGFCAFVQATVLQGLKVWLAYLALLAAQWP